MNLVRRLSRIDLISADPGALAVFYEALGCTLLETTDPDAGVQSRLALRLGRERIDLIRPSGVGAPYPPAIAGWNLLFQHFAIVVSDMREAYAKLQSQVGWTAISIDGPQRLPKTSGGVTAFKFRDPEGHPLELIAFPPARAPDRWNAADAADVFLGIDHSAVSVSDTDRSVTFYENLGLSRAGGSINVGIEQARLDDLPGVHVEVSALSAPRDPAPHVELLCYHGDFIRHTRPPSLNDIAASRLVFTGGVSQGKQAAPLLMRDPDGHIIIVEDDQPCAGST